MDFSRLCVFILIFLLPTGLYRVLNLKFLSPDTVALMVQISAAVATIGSLIIIALTFIYPKKGSPSNDGYVADIKWARNPRIAGGLMLVFPFIGLPIIAYLHYLYVPTDWVGTLSGYLMVLGIGLIAVSFYVRKKII